MDKKQIDIKENYLYRLDWELLTIMLKDHSSGKNIIWATDNYAHRGAGFQRHDHIEISSITGYHGNVVKPRVEKSKKEQIDRIKQKAEVFTPSWICNKQNNLVDNAWFGAEDVFNVEHEQSWTAAEGKISFPSPSGKTWGDYVRDVRLEITCGEAPYLTSRYHATKCLIELTCFKCTKHLALIHLSQIMNTGSQAEKIAILTRLRQIQADDDAYVKQIVNKGRSDNNYLVRFVAERENHEYD